MAELQVAEDGRYLGGDIPFGYTLWGDRPVEVPAELDACVTGIRLVKQGKRYPEIASGVRQQHGVTLSQRQFDALMRASIGDTGRSDLRLGLSIPHAPVRLDQEGDPS